MSELTVLLPAYNEEENLEILVEEWQTYRETLLEEYNLYLKILVVNDGSRDKTKEIGERLERSQDNFVLLNHERNRGLGQALKTGISYILRDCRNSDFVCIMDCDNTQNPGFIVNMLRKQAQEKSDVVIASRYQKGADVKGLSSFRLLASRGAKTVYSLLLGVENVRDYTCGYRVYNNKILKEAYERFGDHLLDESGFTCMAELLYKLYACGGTFSEVPFELRYDLKGGASKMKVLKTAVNSVMLAWRLRKIPKQKKFTAPVEFVGTKGEL